MQQHYVYFLYSTNSNKTYIGYTTDPIKRIKQHNCILVGGAKYTTSHGPWVLFCLISGFKDKYEALQAEWAIKYYTKRTHHPIINRINSLNTLIKKNKWTNNSTGLINNQNYILEIDIDYLSYFEIIKQYNNFTLIPI